MNQFSLCIGQSWHSVQPEPGTTLNAEAFGQIDRQRSDRIQNPLHQLRYFRNFATLAKPKPPPITRGISNSAPISPHSTTLRFSPRHPRAAHHHFGTTILGRTAPSLITGQPPPTSPASCFRCDPTGLHNPQTLSKNRFRPQHKHNQGHRFAT